MSGIDRADDVYLKESYVLLTNTNDEGELEGFKDITNLYVPEGSGIKISAESELLGNFEGGGELYLDSEVCLIVDGDITGNTTLTLNPNLYDGENKIYGSEDYPYLRIYGTHPEEDSAGAASALISGDWRYEIIYKETKDSEEKDCTIYYIAETITVNNSEATYTMEEGTNYNDEITKEGPVYILENGQVSEQVDITYEWTDDGFTTERYKSTVRSIYIISGVTIAKIPAGTKIIMVTGGKYYYYIVTEDTEYVELSNFIQMETNNSYKEMTDITDEANGATKTTNPTTGKDSYTNTEEYRFIIDFTNSTSYLGTGNEDYYNILLQIASTETGEEIASITDNATNRLKVYSKKQIECELNTSKEKYKQDGNIEITGKINLTEINSNVEYFKEQGKELGLNLSITNEAGEEVTLPTGTIVTINGTEYTDLNNLSKVIIDAITSSAQTAELNIEIDIENTIESERLSEGTYNIQLEFYATEDGILETLLDTKVISFNIINSGSNYGIQADLIDDTKAYDKAKIFTEDGETRTLQINVDKDNLDGAYVTIKLLQKTGEFTFEEIKNTVIDATIDLSSTNTLTVTNKGLSSGTYRLKVNLYDKYGNYYSSDVVNFIVM